MKIVIGNDHVALEMKLQIKEYLEQKGIEVIDVGTDSPERCDYPVYGEKAAKMVVSGEGAVKKCRSLMGATDPAEAAPGTIRGDFGLIMDENVIHGSDSVESAEREIGIFFK